ncbi:hydrogenase nickel incorporation protein HypB, partial [candidate division KSB1 bacterium]|nr:hydrogenase nickel incorporation protein HypB [candidate division KSB1 bacterium]
MKVSLVKDILHANERIANQNRELFTEKGILVINLMSAPGAGKTTIIEHTINALKNDYRIGVIEGDIQSTYDADKISATGVQVVQINTGGACHLDGNMIREAFDQIDLDALDLLIVENVGNLVCPAEFNVGEDFKAMLLSVPEGDDKPLKYPLMFHESE